MSIRILEYVCSFLLAFIQMCARPDEGQEDRSFVSLSLGVRDRDASIQEFSIREHNDPRVLAVRAIKAGATGVAKSVPRDRWHLSAGQTLDYHSWIEPLSIGHCGES